MVLFSILLGNYDARASGSRPLGQHWEGPGEQFDVVTLTATDDLGRDLRGDGSGRVARENCQQVTNYRSLWGAWPPWRRTENSKRVLVVSCLAPKRARVP